MNNFTDKKIAYQGAPGSYSHQCLSQKLSGGEAQGHNTFEGAIKAVQSGDADYALLPVENSIAGRVMDIHHLLANSGLQILTEYYHPIVHCLIAKSGAKLSEIKRAYSHPMALAQCRDFLYEQDIDIVSFTDTAEAADFVSKQDSLKVAAIASSNNIEIYDDLVILKEDIQDVDDNTTRFFLLAKGDANMTRINDEFPQTTAIFFTIKNIPATLHESLSGFADSGVNVTRLESFMPLMGNGSARFYIEIDGAPQDTAVKLALQELELVVTKVEILGTFEKVT